MILEKKITTPEEIVIDVDVDQRRFSSTAEGKVNRPVIRQNDLMFFYGLMAILLVLFNIIN